MSSHRLSLALCLAVLPATAWGWASWDPQAGPKGALPGDVGTLCEDLSTEPITYGMIYEVPGTGLPDGPIDIQDIWGAGGCLGCHNVAAMGGLRLDQPANGGYELINAISFRDPDILLVDPGKPERSLLYTQLNCTPPAIYPAMPPPVGEQSQRINRQLRAMVFDWIAQGARGFDEDGNPYTDVLYRDQMESLRFQRNLAVPPP